MSQLTIDIGTTANDGTGDPGRTAFGKVNDNFTELYSLTTAQTSAIALNTTHRGLTTGNPHNVTASDLSLVIGTNVQAWDADLDTWATKNEANYLLTDGSRTTAGLTSSGVISVDDTTQSTSTTTGSIHTDGGLGVVLDAFIGGGLGVTGNMGLGASPDANRQILIKQTADGDTNGFELENVAGDENFFFFIDASDIATFKSSSGMKFQTITDDIRFFSQRNFYFDVGVNDRVYFRDSSFVPMLTIEDSTKNAIFVGEVTATNFNMATQQTYTLNATSVVDRTLLASASATTINNNNVLAGLITDLKTAGIIA